MDRYEFDIKIEQIKKLMKKKDFAAAVKIADAIDWKKVKENSLLIMAADVYEVSGRYDDAREALLLAYERTGLGRMLAYRLCRLSVKRGDFKEADEFYEEFTNNSPNDAGKYILQYEMAKGKGEPLDVQIGILETFIEVDMDDRWAYELAKLYHKSNLSDKCVELCDTIILWFADGKYVEKALELKQLYVPLSENQKIKYEAQKSKKGKISEIEIKPMDDLAIANIEEVSQSQSDVSEEERLDLEKEMDIDVNDIHVRDFSTDNKYDTMNIQNELAKSLSSFFDDSTDVFKPVKSTSEIEGSAEDDQIEGQMNLEEVLAMFESGEIRTRDKNNKSTVDKICEEKTGEIEDSFDAKNNNDAKDRCEVEDAEEIAEKEDIEEIEVLGNVIAEEINKEVQEEIEEKLEQEKKIFMYNLKDDFEEELSEGDKVIEIEESSAADEEMEVEGLSETDEEMEAEELSETDEEMEAEESSETDEVIEAEDVSVLEEKPVTPPVKQSEIAKVELKKFITKFSGIKGLDKQILKVLQNVLKTDLQPVKFVFVKGEVRSGKTTLAIEVIKVINRIIRRKNQKIAKIKGININDKSIDVLLETLNGSDVLIERVSDMDIEVFIEFINKLREEGKPRVVIFEDEKTLAEAYLEELPEDCDCFKNVIDIKLNEIRDWASIAEKYAKERGYRIDAMGTLALSAKIDRLKAVTLVIHNRHIEELVDYAIADAEKFSVKRMFSKMFRKKDKLKTLTEKNFI